MCSSPEGAADQHTEEGLDPDAAAAAAVRRTRLSRLHAGRDAVHAGYSVRLMRVLSSILPVQQGVIEGGGRGAGQQDEEEALLLRLLATSPVQQQREG